MNDTTAQDRHNNFMGNLMVAGVAALAITGIAIACWAGLT
jgi:hypothetical protein